MNQKYIAIAAIVFIAWFSWFYRYDVSDNGYLIIDRLTGDLFGGFGKKKLNLHDTPDGLLTNRGLSRFDGDGLLEKRGLSRFDGDGEIGEESINHKEATP